MTFLPLSLLFWFVIKYLSAAGAAAASISTFVIVVTKRGFYSSYKENGIEILSNLPL